MPRKAPEIVLTEEQKAQLEKVTRSHSAERRSVERAKIILACVAGKQNLEIALDYQMSLVFDQHYIVGYRDFNFTLAS